MCDTDNVSGLDEMTDPIDKQESAVISEERSEEQDSFKKGNIDTTQNSDSESVGEPTLSAQTSRLGGGREKLLSDSRKVSVACTVGAALLHALAVLPLICVTLALAVKSYKILPAYNVWHFIGFILICALSLVYAGVALLVTKKNSKSSVMSQTAKIAVTYVCLTSVFGIIVGFVLPDIVANATSSTIFAEDVFYNSARQIEKNAELERKFIMYNLLNGSLNKYDSMTGALAEDYSYAGLEAHDSADQDDEIVYDNYEINASYSAYAEEYNNKEIDRLLANMKTSEPYKYELYQFVYKTYVLNDIDYALNYISYQRRHITLAIVDYIYAHSNYPKLIADGFKNAKVRDLFERNYENFDKDGYKTFDDALLLYAQMDKRMTIPVLMGLLLNKGWQYSEATQDGNGQLVYKDGAFLYEVYDPAALEEYDGDFPYEETLVNADGSKYTANYGINDLGWKVFENGIVKRPVKWLVLDMLGDPMSLASLNLKDVSIDLSSVRPGLKISIDMLLQAASGVASGLVDGLGEVLHEDVAKLVYDVTNGGEMSIGVYVDDDGTMQIQVLPMNAAYGMLGYMQATWVQSEGLLMAVINVLAIRDWLYIFGAVGLLLIFAAGALRECGQRARERVSYSNAGAERADAPFEETAQAHDDISCEQTIEDGGSAQEEESEVVYDDKEREVYIDDELGNGPLKEAEAQSGERTEHTSNKD